MGTFLNTRRLRDYPRLFLITTWTLLLLNAVFHNGWLGASGQLIGTDFIMLYSGGKLARFDPGRLYDFDLQGSVQQELVHPTRLWGFLPYNYPPYVAFIIQPITYIPLAWALGLWSLATIALGILAAWLLHKELMPENLKASGLNAAQITIVALSFFPYVEGLLVGQNHGLTLLLTAGILICMHRERWNLAGVLAGLSIYKPQFALGFLILWFAWGKWRALVAYAATALVWVGTATASFGVEPFLDYLRKMNVFLQLLYVEGFGTVLEVTPYGLLVSLFPPTAWERIVMFTQVFSAILAVGLAIYAWRLRHATSEGRLPAITLALLFPLLAAPHTLLHDLVVLVPALILWARWKPWQGLIRVSVAIYLATFLLPWVAYLTGIPWMALIPLILAGLLVNQILVQRTTDILIPT